MKTHCYLLPCLRTPVLILALLLTSSQPASAFFFSITEFIMEVGEIINVVVKGSSAGAAVSVQSVNGSPPGLISHDVTSPRNGTGSVNVGITGVAPGSGSVGFSGTNNGGSVFGSLNFTILGAAGTTAQQPHVGIGGDPVNTSTGEYFGNEAVDLNLGGPMPLIFSRYVASKLAADGFVQAALGANRSHNFASRIVNVTLTIKRVVLPSGRVLRFDKAGTKWTLKSPLDVPFQLQETTAEMLLADPHTKQIWTYDKATGRLSRIEDGKGNVHTLTYTSGKLSSVSDGLGRTINISQPGTTITSVEGVTGAETRTVTFAYTSGVLTSATDYGGHTTTYANSGGLPTSHTRPVGNTPFTQAYTSGKVTTQTERGSDTSTLTYGTNTTTFTDPTLATLVDNYDAKGRLISHVDEDGKAITMTYDSAGRRTTVTDRLGQKITILYHALSGQPHTITNAEGKSTLIAFKPRTLMGFVFQDTSKITWPDLSSRSFTYDAKGNLTQITDEAGKNWKYTYNTKGQVLTATNPLGGVTTNIYDAAGNLTSTTPQDSGATTFTYDARHRLTQVTRPGGATVLFAYDAKDRLTSRTDERGKVWQYTYDNNDRLTVVTDPDTATANVGHDVLDRPTTITDRLGNSSTLAFDSRHLLSSLTDRNGNTINLTYDARRRLTGLEDPGGEEWVFTYDDEGRLLTTQTPLDPPTNRKLNKLGMPEQMSDPLGNTWNYKRDAVQRVTASFDPLGRQKTFVYDKRGLLISATEQGTGTAKYDRDALGNMTKITDTNGGAWSMIYQKSGRLLKSTDPLGKSSTLEYDARGRVTKMNFPDATNCTLGYDAVSNLTSAVFSGAGPSLAFTYDNQNGLISVTDAALAANNVAFEYDDEGRITNCEQNTHDYTATYDNGGRLQTVGYHDGLFSVTYAYDTRDRLTSVTDSEGTVVSFVYDAAGRLTQQNRTPGIDTTYVYDAAGRMTQIQDGAVVNLSYELNAASEVVDLDITAPTLPGVTAASQLFKFGKAGEIISTGHVYDVRGRLTAAPTGRTYGWDGASRLVNANGVTLTYNGLGSLATRTEAAQTTRFYHHYALGLAQIVHEDLPTGSDRFYVWTPGGRLLYSVDSVTGDPTFYHFDRMGSTLALTDKTGTVTDSYAYGPYGEPLGRTGTSSQPFTYIGAYGVRVEGQLYHMRARYYEPASARFLSRDPLPPRLSDPKSTNTYAYASQNPLMYLDPRGTSSHREAPAMPELDAGTNDHEGLAMASLFGQIFLGPISLNDSRSRDSVLGINSVVEYPHDDIQLPTPLPFGGLPLIGDEGSGTTGASALLTGANITQLGGLGNDGFGFESGISAGLGDDYPLDGGLYNDPNGPGLAYDPGPAFDELNFTSRIRVGFSVSGTTDGGIEFGGTINFDNATISGNTADAALDIQAIIDAAVMNHFIDIYKALDAAEKALTNEMIHDMKSTPEKVQARDDIKKQRKAIGKIIERMGGTIPR